MSSGMLFQIRSNSKLRWGLWIIFGILWLYAVLVLRDVLRDKQDEYHTIIQSGSRLNAQLAQPEWINRAVSAKTVAVQMESRLWQAPTSGLAQAEFQEWLKTTLAQVGFTQPLLNVTVLDLASPAGAAATGTAVSAPTDLWKVRATLSLEFDQKSFITLLNKIEFGEKLVSIETLSIRKEPVPRVDIQLITYFQKQINREQFKQTKTSSDESPTPLIDFHQKPAEPERSSTAEMKPNIASNPFFAPLKKQAETEHTSTTQPATGPLNTSQAEPEQSNLTVKKQNVAPNLFADYLKKQAEARQSSAVQPINGQSDTAPSQPERSGTPEAKPNMPSDPFSALMKKQTNP